MKEFDETCKKSPIFIFLRTYMAMVSVLVSFVRAVTGHWKLHKTALRRFLKYFFAQN